MERKKALKYAYSSSPSANRLNKGLGCWLIEDESGLPPLVFQDSEKFEALKIFEDINLPIDLTSSFTKDHETFKK